MSVLKTIDVHKQAGKAYVVNGEMYGTVNEMVDLLEKRKITDSCFDNQRTKSHRKDWEGVDSYEEAIDLLHNGWQTAVDKLKQGIKANYVGEGKRITFHNDVVGYAPIVPLALQGVPQSMLNHNMKPIKAKVIDVVYNIAVSSSYSPDEILKSGQNLLTAVLGLEQEGYKVNIYAMQAYAGNNDCDMLLIKIKDSRQPMDLKRMSFPLTHPAFFRVIGFDWYSKVPGGKYRGGYGYPISHSLSVTKARDVVREFCNNDKAVVFFAQEMKNKTIDYIKEVIKNESGNKRN